jgi:hypothetical protein
MKTENNSLYEIFREKHAALESAQQHIRDLTAAIEGMRGDLVTARTKLEARQREDALFLSDAITAKASRDTCTRCKRPLGDGTFPLCLTCSTASRGVAEAVSLAEASISGSVLNLQTAQGEIDKVVRPAEILAFEKWISEEFNSEAESLSKLLEKCYSLAARIEGLSSLGNRRRFDDHLNGRGGAQLPVGICRHLESALLALTPGNSYSADGKRRASLEAVRNAATAEVMAKAFEKIPSGKKRPEAPMPTTNNWSAAAGPISVRGADGQFK